VAGCKISYDLSSAGGAAVPLRTLAGGILNSATRDRSYDFLIIFAEKFSENIGVFCSIYC
jgi:hypothetical protein